MLIINIQKNFLLKKIRENNLISNANLNAQKSRCTNIIINKKLYYILILN